MTKSVLTVPLVAALALSLTACSSSKRAPQSTATCSSASPATTLPTPVSNPSPGQVRWSVLLDRCTGKARKAWADMSDSETGTLGPGNELLLDLDGTISRFDLSTGARSWRRTVVPPAGADVYDSVAATQDLVLVTLTMKSPTNEYAFLDARTGEPLGAMIQQPDGTPELVGGHVVLVGGGTVSGYDPRTGTTSWQVKYRPPSDGWDSRGPNVAHDDATLYLEPPGGASDEIMRVDAATGHLLPSLRLPAAAHLTPSRTELPETAPQGTLVLWEHSPTPSSAPPGGTGVYPIVRSVAVDTRTGALVWSRPDWIVSSADSGPLSDLGDGGVFTALDPSTGKTLWTVTEEGLVYEDSMWPVEALPDYLVQVVQAGDDLIKNDPGMVEGVPPTSLKATHPAWHSVTLSRPQLVAANQQTAVVSTCDPFGNPMQPAGCADRELIAIAV